MTLEKILVPLDGSDLPEAALETAIELLNEQPVAMLVLLRAAEASRPLGSDRTEKQVRAVREAESYLNGVVAGLREAGGEWGEPADDVAALSINFLFYGLRSRAPNRFAISSARSWSQSRDPLLPAEAGHVRCAARLRR